jgi:hypothetical protein
MDDSFINVLTNVNQIQFILPCLQSDETIIIVFLK